jgi:hypothetical protein
MTSKGWRCRERARIAFRSLGGEPWSIERSSPAKNQCFTENAGPLSTAGSGSRPGRGVRALTDEGPMFHGERPGNTALPTRPQGRCPGRGRRSRASGAAGNVSRFNNAQATRPSKQGGRRRQGISWLGRGGRIRVGRTDISRRPPTPYGRSQHGGRGAVARERGGRLTRP